MRLCVVPITVRLCACSAMFAIITDPAVKKEIDDMFDYGEVVDELNAQVWPQEAALVLVDGPRGG